MDVTLGLVILDYAVSIFSREILNGMKTIEEVQRVTEDESGEEAISAKGE